MIVVTSCRATELRGCGSRTGNGCWPAPERWSCVCWRFSMPPIRNQVRLIAFDLPPVDGSLVEPG
jgi:hypothetical protein